MKHPLALALALALAASPAAFAQPPAKSHAVHAKTQPAAAANPFFQDSPLPLHYPQFDKIKDSDFAPAFDRGMAENLKEIQAIADNKAKPTFDNTIVAMEKSGRTLTRAGTVFGNLVGADTNPARDKLDAEYSPKFAAHRDAIYLNPKLFARVQALYDQRASLGLDAEGVRLVEKYYQDFVRAGAKLSDADKTKLKQINAELASLGTQFSQNVLAERNDLAVVVDSRDELKGLPDEAIAAAQKAAKDRKLEGKYVIELQNTTIQPPLTYLDNRALRERIFKASISRNSRGNQWDNTGIVSKVAKLRAEKARMLGYPTYAAYALEDRPRRRRRPSTTCSASWRRRPWRMPGARPPTCRRSSTRNRQPRASRPSSSSRGTGPTTRRRCARRATTSTTRSSSRTSSSTTSSRTASSTPPTRNTG
jgi:peptidyl-dipeptidase Dcp